MARRLLLSLLIVAVLVTIGDACCLFMQRPRKLDPIDMLNDKLVDLTKEIDLASNVKAAFFYMVDAEYKNHPNKDFKRAVKMFGLLNFKEKCDIANFYLLRKLFELASRKNLEDIRAAGTRRRLIRILHNLRLEAKFDCFARLEVAWKEKRRLNRYFEEEKTAELAVLGPLLASHAEEVSFMKSFEVKQLSGAMQLMRRRWSVKSTADLFRGEELKEVLMTVNERQKGYRALKVDEKSGKPLKLDRESAFEPLQEYLLNPCRELMAQKVEIETFLEPMVNIATFILVDDLVKPIGFNGRFYAIDWAARYAACSLLLAVDASQLAAKVARVRRLT